MHRGIAVHVLRNICSMSGIRVFSPITTNIVASFAGDACETPSARFVSDFMASVIAAALSMPAN